MIENLKIGSEYDGFLFLAESVKNPPALRPHHHVELELNLVAAGSVTYVVGGQRFTFSKRTLLWMFPDQEHQLVDRTSDAEYYVAVFKPDLIERACRGSRYSGLKKSKLSKEGVLHTKLPPEDFDMIRRTMDSVLTEGIDAELLNKEAGFGLSPNFTFRHNDPDWLNAGLRHLLLLSWRHQQGRRGTGSQVRLHPAVRKALHWINHEREYTDGSSLSEYCGVSESYLSRLFHKQIGVPLTRYRNSVRLSNFWEAYRSKENPTILEAVFEGGFGSYAQFYRVFREVYGYGPREALKQSA